MTLSPSMRQLVLIGTAAAFQLPSVSFHVALSPRVSSARLAAVPPEPLEQVDDASYETAVVEPSRAGTPVLVDFFTDWCGPCKIIEPLLRELHQKGDVKVVKAKPEETESFRAWLEEQGKHISGLPTCVLFENGKPRKMISGAFNMAKLEAFVDSTIGTVMPVIQPQMQRQPAYAPITEESSPHERWSTHLRCTRKRGRFH